MLIYGVVLTRKTLFGEGGSAVEELLAGDGGETSMILQSL